MNAVNAQQTLNQFSTLFQWMSDAGYLPGNPWQLTSALTKDTRLGQHCDTVKSSRELTFSCIKAIRHYLDHGAEFEDDGQGLDADAPPVANIITTGCLPADAGSSIFTFMLKPGSV